MSRSGIDVSVSLWSNSASNFALLVCYDGVMVGRTIPLSTPNPCILLTKLQVPPPLDAVCCTPPLPTTHHLLPITSFARRLTIAPPLAFSPLTRSGWLACARDDISAWCFCSPVLFSQLHRQLRFIFTVVEFCIDLCSACML